MRLLFTLWAILSAFSLHAQPPSYTTSIGDLVFNADTDRADFVCCYPDYVFQYFNDSKGLQYEGEKPALERAFLDNYRPPVGSQESGLLRIRFLVNCKGDTDRFRLMGMDFSYTPKTFDPVITNQLLAIAKGLKGWKPKQYRNVPIDYYQYLIFKIEKGHIQEILP